MSHLLGLSDSDQKFVNSNGSGSIPFGSAHATSGLLSVELISLYSTEERVAEVQSWDE